MLLLGFILSLFLLKTSWISCSETQGGMKATVFNDAFQVCVIVFCWVMALIFGHQEAGTLSEVHEIALNGGRLNFDRYARGRFSSHKISQLKLMSNK